MVVIKTCKRLGAMEEALTMVCNPVKYGLFPARNASAALLVALEKEGNIEGLVPGEGVCVGVVCVHGA